MIYGRKGSVQLRIFRSKDNKKEINSVIDNTNNNENSIDGNLVDNDNSENKLPNDQLTKTFDNQKPHFKTTNDCDSSSNNNEYVSNKPLYLDSDDLLKEAHRNNNIYNDQESAIAEDDDYDNEENKTNARNNHRSRSLDSSPCRKRTNSTSENCLSLHKRRTSSSGYNKFIELKPFKNKVGGHTEIFKFSKRAICKTLVNEENQWYEHLENQFTEKHNRYCGILLKFMPKYIGILNVRRHLMETEVTMNDNIHLFSQKLLEKYNISVDVDDLTEECHQTSLNTKLKDQVLTEVFKCDGLEFLQENENKNNSYNDNNSRSVSPTAALLPEDDPTPEVQQYILLEDLTRKMKNATVLDLKMGTRQYGVYANCKKKKSQSLKCKLTTSHQLGCRVCGMKIYRPLDDSFIKRDKYFGRRIQIGWQFARVLLVFLYDGISQQSILQKIPKLIKDLNELITAVENLPGYRMYGASLLFMYDNEDSECKIYLIDFAQCITRETFLNAVSNFTCKPSGGIDSTDNGFIKGLKSLQFYLKKTWDLITDNKSIDDFVCPDSGSLDKQAIEQFCQQDKFNTKFEWLDSFTEEKEEDFNNANCEMRTHWKKFETLFDIRPPYSNINHPFDESE